MKCVMLSVVILMLMCGCEPVPKSPEAFKSEMEAGPLAFLQDGRTTREEVLLRLGVPTATFESQRILTYRLWMDSKNGLATAPLEAQTPYTGEPWAGLTCSLVLVFDGANKLARHSVVPLKVGLASPPS